MTVRSFGETVAPGFNFVFEGRLLHSEQSPFQHIEVYEHEYFGRVLVLDHTIQTTLTDEFAYHELLVHPALCSLPEPRDVLIIGGGDGGTLRRVLEHGPVRAVQCEIDEAVTRVSREHLPEVSAGALDDPRAELVFDDGAAYAAAHPAEFDAVIVDSTDPVGAAAVLVSESFYRDCLKALKPGGVLVAQTGSPLYQANEFRVAVSNMSRVFDVVEPYFGIVPTYPGAYWSWTAATQGPPVSRAPMAVVRGRMSSRNLSCGYYTPELHRSLFAVPGFAPRPLPQKPGAGA
ncbi:MAG TPA: polyamine aminopropyltransferase [Actinomycetota bacterium]|nr:polyamine aminopropyltransferase [Actinomycetota bacterium]